MPSLQIGMQPIGKPSGKVHASQPILAQKPRYTTEKARTARFSRIEDIRDPGFLSEGSPQTLGNPLDRGTSRGIPRFCAQFFLSTCIFSGKPVAHARHSPPPRRVIHAIVNGKDQLVATRAARGPQAKLRSARFTGETPQPVASRASAHAPHEPRRQRALTARCASKATSAVRRREDTRATSTLAASTSRKKGTPCTNSA